MKVKRLLVLMLIALSIGFVSCKKDRASTTTGGGSNPINPTNCDDPEGTITANLRNDSGYITVLNGTLKMNTADNFEFNSQPYHERTFVNIGEVDGLGCVENIPQSGWSNQVAVIPGNGYVVKDKYDHPYYPDDKYTKYARIYVTRYILSANYEILGAELKYQDNWKSLLKVTTDSVTNITTTSATCGGSVTDDGALEVIARGVCWSTNQNPTINDSHTTNGTGIGVFTSIITGLSIETKYYVRAYATTNQGTSYGIQKEFITRDGIPTVTTSDVANITTVSATCGGYVTDDGGIGFTARGVCWNTTQNPTINDSHTTDGTGTGAFTSNITGLASYTTYYVRAYATNNNGTSYGEQKSFKTLYDFPDGSFSVNDHSSVFFSQGNLQYQASTNTWRFAENQYDYIGSDNANISSSYSGWIDLFGWGTGNNPTNSSTYEGDYSTFNDWGNNAISNGGGKSWRTLTANELEYVFNARNTISGIRYAKARVNGINGVILLPDNWNSDTYSLNSTNTSGVGYSNNTISLGDWTTKLEANGAVFLPAAGSRDGTSVSNVSAFGQYWSSSYVNDAIAYGVHLSGGDLVAANWHYRRIGISVRLVSDAN